MKIHIQVDENIERPIIFGYVNLIALTQNG